MNHKGASFMAYFLFLCVLTAGLFMLFPDKVPVENPALAKGDLKGALLGGGKVKNIPQEVYDSIENNSEFSQYLQGPKKHVFTLSLRGCPYAKAFANAIDQAFLEEEIATAYQKDIVPIGRSEYLNCNGKQCPRMYLFNTCGQGLCIINPAKRQIVVEKSRSKERAARLNRDGRAHMVAPADYSEGKAVDKFVKAVIECVVANNKIKNIRAL